MIGREDEVREYRELIGRYYYIVFGAMLLILFRLFYLQVIKGDDLRKFSEANRLKKERRFSTRGVIYDRNGKVIVDNRASFDIVLFSQYYPFTPEMNKRLAKALEMPIEDLDRRLAKVSRTPSFYPILLRSDVSKDVLAAIEMDPEGFPGVDIEANVQRRYPHTDLAAQLLGYVGEVDTRDIKRDPTKMLQPGDYIGKMGIERHYDAELRGQNGVGYVEVDASGRRRKSERGEKLLGFVAQTEPVAGNNVYLTLDMDLQWIAAKAMKARNFQGSVVAMDPQNGEILVMVNNPSYDPGKISGREVNQKIWSELRESKDRPLRNRAVQDHYPPGSTFKLFVAMAALVEGVANTKTSFTCHGGLHFGSRRFNCWKRHGPIDFVHAIKESCDIYFYNLGLQLGIDNIAKYARLFGLGELTHLNLPNEQRGLIPDSKWKLERFKEAWQPGETLSVAIGQGYVASTPLQLASSYAAIANGGFLYRPYILKKIEGLNGQTIKEYQPELTRKIEIPTEAFDAVKEGLYEVVNSPGGTAFGSRSRIVGISGKTGTAQVRQFADINKVKKCDALEYSHRHHGLFVGFAPRKNPQIAVVTIAEHACHGASAAPIVKEIVEAYVQKHGIVDETMQTDQERTLGSGTVRQRRPSSEDDE